MIFLEQKNSNRCIMVKKYLLLILAIFFLAGCENKSTEAIQDINIVPEPLEITINKGQFKINEQTKILVYSNNEKVKSVAQYFAQQFNTASGNSLKVIVSQENNRSKNIIEFTDKNLNLSLGDEGYTLQSNSDKIILRGSSNGLFYGVQTLFQLLPTEIYSSEKVKNVNWNIPAVQIKDKPRFVWRGMHLDVGRHLFPVSFIKKYIDYIAMHKLNVFHWHLTEDQGWRIEIKKYPRLTEVGAWRKGTQIKKTDKDDGAHSAHEEEGEIALKAGMHKLQLDYFQAGGGRVLQVFMKGQGEEKVEIGDLILSH
jgi:hexosaminidase